MKPEMNISSGIVPAIYINSAYAVLPSRGPEPDYKETIRDANLRRRMSRIVKAGVSCALRCLDVPVGGEAPYADNPSGGPDSYVHPDAIVTATALGCLADSEKFMSELLDRGEEMLNPTAFIQSVFNTVGAQTALLNKVKSYNMTYVHRGSSFSSALLDGILLISEGKHNVLVEAFDEKIPASEDILKRLGKWREGTEGAVSFLLSDTPRGSGSIALSSVRLKSGCGTGHVYDSMDSAVRMYDAVLAAAAGGENEFSMPAMSFVLSLEGCRP